MQVSDHKAVLVTIDESQSGQRIDNFLVKHLKGVPRSHIYRLLRSGQVRVNSGRKKPHYKLKTDDILRVPPVRITDEGNYVVPASIIQKLEDSILYEDDNIFAINKPSGIAVHKGSGLNFGIIEACRQMYPEQPLELVHRLDRETSGCLLLAKNRQILAELHELLRHEKIVRIEKTYLALVCGQWNQGSTTVDMGISKIKRGGEHVMQTDESGDQAISHFEPLEVFEHCSLMKVSIETGRTHQIRVHAKHCGHPIVGDSKYGNKPVNQSFRELGLKRLFLHAQQLQLPLSEPITINAPLSDDLEQLLKQLRLSQ